MNFPSRRRADIQSADGLKFTVEMLDTWNMTVTPVPGEFTLKKKDNYSFADKDGRAIPLPGKPYQAIRLKVISGAPGSRSPGLL